MRNVSVHASTCSAGTSASEITAASMRLLSPGGTAGETTTLPVPSRERCHPCGTAQINASSENQSAAFRGISFATGPSRTTGAPDHESGRSVRVRLAALDRSHCVRTPSCSEYSNVVVAAADTLTTSVDGSRVSNG